MDIKEQIAVMQGFADGKEVEFKAKDSSCWKTPNRNTFKPVWNWHEYYYRIKPKTIKYKRYLEKALGNIFVAIYQQNEELLPEKHLEDSNDFLCWIDKEWQEVECPI